MTTEAVPLCSLEAEKSILSIILMENEGVLQALEYVRTESFYDDRHRVIFQAMLDIVSERRGFDQFTLMEYLKQRDELHQAGGSEYIATLRSETLDSSHFSNFCHIVRKKEILRQLSKIGSDIVMQCSTDNAIPEEIADNAYGLLNNVAANRMRPMYRPLCTLVKDTFGVLQNIRENPSRAWGISTGFQELDAMILGLRQGTLTVIAAGPSMGMTSLAINLLYNVGIVQNQAAVFISLDRTAEYISARLISTTARVETRALIIGQLSNDDWLRISNAAQELQVGNLFLDDSPDISMREIRCKSIRLKTEHNIELIIVDGLHLLQMDRQSLAQIFQDLKALAIELSVPVVVTYRLDGSLLDIQGGRRPTLGSLHGDVAIERYADVIMFLHRETQSCGLCMKNDGSCHQNHRHIADIIIGKQDGPLGTVLLSFKEESGKFATFENQLHERSS